MANEAGAQYSGVLCGRATWQNGISAFARHGRRALETWLEEHGVANVQTLNQLIQNATPWHERLHEARV